MTPWSLHPRLQRVTKSTLFYTYLKNKVDLAPLGKEDNVTVA